MDPTSDPDIELRWQKIRDSLERHASDLIRRGSLVAKKTPSGRHVWVLRFQVREQGRARHRSVYIGGEEQRDLLRRVRQLLREYRSVNDWLRQVTAYARFAASVGVVLRRSLSPRKEAASRRRVRTKPANRG